MKKFVCFLVVFLFAFSCMGAFVPQTAAYAAGPDYTNYSAIRILLSAGSANTASFIPNGNYSVKEKPDSDNYLALLYSGKTYTVKTENGVLNLYMGNDLLVGGLNYITIQQYTPDAGKTNTVTVYNTYYKKNINYAGNMIFRLFSSKLYVINSLGTEQYLYGVLPYEMSDSWPAEALKAQAIAARSFAISRMGDGSYDTTDTPVSSQDYEGYSAGNTNCKQAVDNTKGNVLQYDKKTIEAYFGASNGGITDLPSHKWAGAEDGPYSITTDTYDIKNTNSEWEKIFFPKTINTANKIIYSSIRSKPIESAKAGAYLKSLCTQSLGFTPTSLTITGITSLTAKTPKTSHTEACQNYTQADANVSFQMTYLSSGKSVTQNLSKTVTLDLQSLVNSSTYNAFGNKDLQLFTVMPESAGFSIYHRRYGNGIGLSQQGAYARANDKENKQYCKDILDFYYPGTSQVSLTYTEPSVPAKPSVPQYTATAAANNNAYGTVSASVSAQGGQLVTLKAMPKQNTSYRFVRWVKNGGSNTASTSESYTFPIAGNDTYTAEFAAIGVPAIAASNAGYSGIALSWTQVAGATGYELYRSTSAAAVGTLIKTQTGTSYTDTGLATGQRYYYRVRALYKASTVSYATYGGYSAVQSATPTPLAPAAKAASASYSSVKVSWGAVGGATKYELYRATSPAGTYKLLTTTASASYTDKSLATGTVYYYKVLAYRQVGSTKIRGAYSAVVSAKPILNKPTIKVSKASSTSMKVSWSKVSGATKYVLCRATSKNGKYSTVTTTASASYTNKGLKKGTTYYYKVKAYRTVNKKNVYGDYSAIVSRKL